MAQPASRPTARQLLGVKKAHIAFCEALQPHVLPAIQEHLRSQLLRPVGEAFLTFAGS